MSSNGTLPSAQERPRTQFEEYLLEERRDLLTQARAIRQLLDSDTLPHVQARPFKMMRDSTLQRVRWIEDRLCLDVIAEINGSSY